MIFSNEPLCELNSSTFFIYNYLRALPTYLNFGRKTIYLSTDLLLLYDVKTNKIPKYQIFLNYLIWFKYQICLPYLLLE